ncbi:hypothetical protein [Marinifilum sp.]|uniref:hypothetical protein n=1 Tax=Marinifilum sp. TaxID=2033137 RepID=UPI003BA9F118
MKIIKWNNIKIELERLFNFRKEKFFLSKLIANFEKLAEKGENIPFKITEIRRKGFEVKVAGLFGFISFNHMPWKYGNHNYWSAVYPSIKGKVFFAKTHQFRKKPLTIILDGEVAQFKKYGLNERDKYKGIIINKTKYGVFIDIGFHFNWNCGSIVGMVHKSNFAPVEIFEVLQIGDTIESFFLGSNNKEQLLFGDNSVSKEWLNGEVEKLIGDILPVKVVKSNSDKTDYLVNGKYNATLPPKSSIYPTKKQLIKNAIKNLKNGDVIHCEVLKIDKLNNTLQLKWDFAHEIDAIISRTYDQDNELKNQINEFKKGNNSIENIANKEIIEKLRKNTFGNRLDDQ